MRLSWLIFFVLAGAHAVAFWLTPEALAPVIAGSVYLPLLPLKALGLPVFAAAESGGWPSPSLPGWAAVLIIWSAIWWTAARLIHWLHTHFLNRPIR